MSVAQHKQDDYALFDPISLAVGDVQAADLFSCG